MHHGESQKINGVKPVDNFFAPLLKADPQHAVAIALERYLETEGVPASWVRVHPENLHYIEGLVPAEVTIISDTGVDMDDINVGSNPP